MTSMAESLTRPEPAQFGVSLTPDPSATEGNVRGWDGSEKRRERRYVTCDSVEVFLLDVAGLRVSGVLRDVSKNGFRVEIDLPVHRGARLKLRLHDQIIFAVARYCRRTVDTYQVGARIEWIYCSQQTLTSEVPSASAGETTQADDPSSPVRECFELARAIVDSHMVSWI
jgi:hypothetical protein